MSDTTVGWNDSQAERLTPTSSTSPKGVSHETDDQKLPSIAAASALIVGTFSMKLPVVAKSGAAGLRQPSTVAGNGRSVTTDATSRIGYFRDQPNPDLQSIRIIQILV